MICFYIGFLKQDLHITVFQKLEFTKHVFPERGFIILVFLQEIISYDLKKLSNYRLLYSDYLLSVQESDSVNLPPSFSNIFKILPFMIFTIVGNVSLIMDITLRKMFICIFLSLLNCFHPVQSFAYFRIQTSVETPTSRICQFLFFLLLTPSYSYFYALVDVDAKLVAYVYFILF